MLIEFRAENHRSLFDEQGLSLEAGNVDGDVKRIREVAELRLLPVAAIYGANGSGKTNVIAALQFMAAAVRSSFRVWVPDEGIPRDPFAWGARRKEPSFYQVTMLIDAVRHEYGFVIDDARVVEEWLYAWPNGRKQVWFERDGDEYRIGEHLHGENKTIIALTRANALFLSTAAQNNHEQLTSVFRWFREVRSSAQRKEMSVIDGPHRWAAAPNDDNAERMESFKQMLRTADVGIVDIRLISDDGGSGSHSRSRFELLHKNKAPNAWLPLEEESHGTQRLFNIGPRVINALATGGLLLLDELEAAFHPLLALEIIRAFHDPGKNPKNAQLIFTTHDTNLIGTVLGEAPLRRDQVWLTEKDDEGATRLYPMTDYKPRKSENLERGYLQGRYGAVPFLGALTWVDK